jgi:hypothetical protein
MEADTRPTASVATDPTSGAWEESTLAALAETPRLAANQPDHGLVWVTRGRLTVTTAGLGTLELAKGSVVAYRLGDSLSWTASPGSHVRWCRREVRLREGEVQPWTPPSRTDEPVVLAPRRRPWMAIASIALLWVGAVTVAWCVSGAHGSRVADRAERLGQPATADVPPTGSALREVLETGHWTVEYAMVTKRKKAKVGLAVPDRGAATDLTRPEGPLSALVPHLREAMAADGADQLDIAPILPNGVVWEDATTLRVTAKDVVAVGLKVAAPSQPTAPPTSAGR